jgi:hypothetical protein
VSHSNETDLSYDSYVNVCATSQVMNSKKIVEDLEGEQPEHEKTQEQPLTVTQ